MDIHELISRLEEIRDDVEQNIVQVKAVFQPNYPLVGEVLTITTIINEQNEPTVYIGVDSGRTYGSDVYYADEIITLEDQEEEN
jgi:hypothetical protein